MAASSLYHRLLFVLVIIGAFCSRESWCHDGKCYDRYGDQRADYVPCLSNANQSSCCAPGDICFSTGLCHPQNPTFQAFTYHYLYACTDRTWQTPACANICTRSTGIGQCTGKPGYYCCYYTEGCDCTDKNNTHYLGQQDIIAILATTSSSTSTARTSSSSSSTSTPAISTSQSSTSSATGSQTTSSALPAATSSVPADSSSSSSSSTMKIGIGVGVGLGVAAIAAIGIFLVLRRKRKARLERAQAMQGSAEPLRTYQDQKNPEYYVYSAQLPSDNQPRAELPISSPERVPLELPGSPTSPRR